MAFPSVFAPHFVSIFPSVSILFHLLRSPEASTLWSSIFLGFIWSVNYILGFQALGLISPISECIPCVFCCDWLTSLRMIFSGSIYLPKNLMNSSVGECQDREAGMGGLVIRGRGDRMGGSCRGIKERG